MSARGRAVAVLAAAAALLALLPAAAWAHAALLHTTPSASGTVNSPPAQVTLSYSEAVEPRFAIVSVTDAAGTSQATARPARSASNPDQLIVPLRHLSRGWYLVYWRVISADGHPVRGAFTFAVGPNPGPAPRFAVPSLSETAATVPLIVARWVAFLAMMVAVGLLAFRLVVARPLLRRVPGASLRAVTTGLAASLVVALVAVPVYLDMSTAKFAERSAIDLGNVVPLLGSSEFGRGWLRLELVLALLALAAVAALWVDRPDRERRSVAEVLAGTGALLAAGAVLLVPGTAGHAAQYSPRGISLALDWAHLVTASLWIGGLTGLIILGVTARPQRVAGMVVVVPRFSRLALASVLGLIGTGTIAAIIRLPTLRSLWDTGYGQALLVKIGLLLVALVLAAVNLLRTKPRLEAAGRRRELGEPTTALLRRLVAGEAALVATAIGAAAVLTSLAPPPKALASVGSQIAARVGPGAVTRTVTHGPYRLRFSITPNRAAVPNAFGVTLTRNGRPVDGADVMAKFTMLDMEMGQQAYHLGRRRPAVYGRSAVPSLVMAGHWGVTFTVRPPHDKPFVVNLFDTAQG